MKGTFIVLEGIDGCGKSTQLNELANWLPLSGLMPNDANLHITREPGGTKLGIALRDILLNTSGIDAPETITELLLYAADRAQHVSQLIIPALNKGDWVLSDRFSASTIAYQGYGRKLNISLIKELEKIATQGISPNKTIWLNISVKESLRRRNKKLADRIEKEGETFLKEVSNGFNKLAQERKWIKINAEQITSLVQKEIQQELTTQLKI